MNEHTDPESEAKDAAAGNASTASFEASVQRLSQIVEKLEAGELPLEQSLQLFEEGIRLARVAQERLDHAEERVEELLSVDAQGRPVLRAIGS